MYYDVKTGQISEKTTFIVKPDNMKEINDETFKETGISQEDIKQDGIPLS